MAAGLLKFAPIVLFAVAVIWILSFPCANVSTGELKPRGLYVDEHALLVQSKLFRNPTYSLPVNQEADNGDVCERLNATNCTRFGSMTELVIRPRSAKAVFESTVLVLPYRVSNQRLQNELINVVQNLISNLRSVRWMAKSVVVLFVPVDGDSPQHILQQWFAARHNPSAEQLRSTAHSMLVGFAPVDIGTIREAYVLDLTALALPTKSPGELTFSTLTLHHTGINGILPNMDMISYLLSIHADLMRTESEVCAADAVKSITQYLQVQRTSHSTSMVLGKAADFAWHGWEEIESSPALRRYRNLCLGLLCSFRRHLWLCPECNVSNTTWSDVTASSAGDGGEGYQQSHSYLHSLFLQHNIDSITVTASPPALSAGMTTAGSAARRRQTTAGAGPSGKGYGPQKLLEVALSFIYISNNLHEELHHSHAYYLLMGGDHFVGIGEYGFTAGLFLVVVLLLLHQVGAHVEGTYLPGAILSALLSLAPVALCVVAVMIPTDSYGCGAEVCVAPDGVQQGGAPQAVYDSLSVLRASGETGMIAAWLIGLVILVVADRCPTRTEECSVLTPTLVDTASPAGTQKKVLHPRAAAQLAVHLMGVLVVLGLVLAHNFSLGALVAVAFLPTLITGTYSAVYGGRNGLERGLRVAVLLCLGALASTGFLVLMDGVWTERIGRSVLQGLRIEAELTGSLTYAVVVLLGALTSYYCVACTLCVLYPCRPAVRAGCD